MEEILSHNLGFPREAQTPPSYRYRQGLPPHLIVSLGNHESNRGFAT